MQFLCLVLIFQTAFLWPTAARLHQLKDKSISRFGHILESDEDKSISYTDSAPRVDADSNQLRKYMEQKTVVQMLQENVKGNHSPAEQVKVTNEVESDLMTMPKVMTRPGKQPWRHTNEYGNGQKHENILADTQKVMPSIAKDGSNLMSSVMLPISRGQLFGSTSVTRNDAQMVNDEPLLRLQDYNLLYNAERQTYFHLHTSNRQPTMQHVRLNRSNTSTTGNRLLHQVVGNTLGAAFGLNTYMNVNANTNTSSEPNSNTNKDTVAMTTQTVYLYDAASLRQSRFNPFNPTRVIIHGWLGNAQANVYSYLVPAYMSLGEGSFNIITVDWGRGAIADYITASYRVKPVGQVLAKFLDFLHKEAGMRYEDLQLIGFSMGAHVAGLAAKHVQTGRVRVIRALDPALPFFRYAQEKERLTKQDADHVEVLHTSAGSYGFDRPLGHVDFYANWGSQQPGCFWHECSHWRAFALFKESLQLPALNGEGPFKARGCQDTEWQQMIRQKQCPQQTGIHVHMGGDLGTLSMEQLAQREGVYYFETHANPPYDIKDTF